MPTIAVKERIEQLIAKAPEAVNKQNGVGCVGWLTAAQNAVQLVCPSSTNPYYVQAQQLLVGARAPHSAGLSVMKMVPLLERLLEEIEGGLLSSIENRAIAVTFDDFIDHGAEYLKVGRKNEASVIAGIVFEDTIRRVCRISEITESGVKLDALITELQKREVLTPLKAKRGRAAAGLRTSAAHARWDDIAPGDVAPVIEFTREVMASHLE
jgi:hypothetical protein